MSDTVKVERTNISFERRGDMVSPTPHATGTGFTASCFSEEMFGDRMEPLLMTDDFVRTAPIVSGPSNITTIMIAKAAGRKI